MSDIDNELWEKSIKASEKALDDMSTFGGRQAALVILQLALYNFAMKDRKCLASN